MKRGVIALGSPSPKIRISKPGVDIDSAADIDFLLHESHLYSQPYYFDFVACPFAGDTSSNAFNQTVSVAIPDVTADPIVIAYVADSESSIHYPAPRSTGPGSSASGFAYEAWGIRVKAESSTSLMVRFIKNAGVRRSPTGAYIILMSKPL